MRGWVCVCERVGVPLAYITCYCGCGQSKVYHQSNPPILEATVTPCGLIKPHGHIPMKSLSHTVLE